MRPSAILHGLLLIALSVCAALGWARNWHAAPDTRETDFTRRRLAFLEQENARLGKVIAEKQRAEEAAAARQGRAEIERDITKLRELDFLHPVTYREIPRSELPNILRQKLAQQAPDQEFGEMGIALSALGLLPHGLDLKKTYLDLLGEQIGAFYDQHTHELFTFSGQPLSNSQNRVILAHELTHALQDQHFNLLRLPLEAKGNDDRVLAASALVEGDATLAMNQFMLANVSAAAVKDLFASALTTDVRQLAAAPHYLRESLLFPYLRGQEFCQTLYQRGGWEALASAFAEPPSSTAQILHPEKYLAQPREEPLVIKMPDDTSVLGQPPVMDNVMGEFGLQQILTSWKEDKKLAPGWRGDRYLVYGDAKASSYVWAVAWESVERARGFRGLAANALRVRYDADKDNAPVEELIFPPASGDAVKDAGSAQTSGGRYIVVAPHAGWRQTLVIDAQDKAWAEALRQRFGVDYGVPADLFGHSP